MLITGVKNAQVDYTFETGWPTGQNWQMIEFKTKASKDIPTTGIKFRGKKDGHILTSYEKP